MEFPFEISSQSMATTRKHKKHKPSKMSQGGYYGNPPPGTGYNGGPPPPPPGHGRPDGTYPVYQIDFTAVASGKRIASTKRRVRW